VSTFNLRRSTANPTEEGLRLSDVGLRRRRRVGGGGVGGGGGGGGGGICESHTQFQVELHNNVCVCVTRVSHVNCGPSPKLADFLFSCPFQAAPQQQDSPYRTIPAVHKVGKWRQASKTYPTTLRVPHCSGVFAQRTCHPVLVVKEVNDMSKQDWFNACNAMLSQDSTSLYNYTIACGVTVVSCRCCQY
jgi:hypothetical protein